jgi:hypothetical protein
MPWGTPSLRSGKNNARSLTSHVLQRLKETRTTDVSDQPDLIGQLAVKLHMVTEEHIQRCLAMQKQADKPLGQLLVELDLLTLGQLNYLIDLQQNQLREQVSLVEQSPEEALFGRLAVHRGLIDDEQLSQAVREKANLDRLKIHFRLGEILIKKGVLTPTQVQELLEVQRKKILVCRSCNCRFNIASFDTQQALACCYCGGALDLPAPGDTSVAVRESLRIPRHQD